MNKKLRSLIAAALLVFMLLPSALAVFASDGTESETQLPGAGSYSHVAVIGVDGGGAFFKDTDTPNIDTIFENGAVTYTAQTSIPSISAQSWGSLLHGVTPAYHKLTNTIAGSTAFDPESEFPSYFRVVHENDPDAVLASFCHWSSINVGIIEDNLGVYKVSGKADETIASEAAAYVSENAPKLLFIQFDEADGAGHGYGYGSETHLETITRLDGYIGQVYQAYVDKGIADDTLFIVTADHGGTPTKDDGSVGGGHGGLTDAEMNIMIAIAGKTVVNGEIGEAEIRDIAAIVTYALGYKNPESWTARVPSGIFEGVVAGERPVYIAKSLNRQHLNIPTPTEGERGHYTNFINKDNLIAYLPFDGMYNDILGNTTTSTGNLYYPQAYFGQGASLDDGYVSLDNTVSGTGDFAVSFWFQSAGVISDPAVISNQDWGSRANQGFSIVMQDTRLLFAMGDGSKGVKIGFNMPEDFLDGWVHVAVSVNRTENTVSVAFDFKEFATKKLIEYNEDGSVKADMTGRDISSTYPINIGQDGTGNYAASNTGLALSVDDVMIFNTKITGESLADLHNYYYCNLTPAKGEVGYITNFITDKPLVNYLNFDGNTEDACGNETKANGAIKYDAGYYGKAAILDAGYVSILNHDPGLNSFTVAFFMNTEKLTKAGDPTIISNKNWQNGANPGWNLSIAENNAGVDSFVFNTKGEADGTKFTKYPAITDLDIDNKWTHVMLVFDREANTVKLLINFQALATWADLPSHSLTTEFPLNIGQDGTGEYVKFEGMVDEFMLFDGALDSDDIAELEKYFDKGVDYDVAVAPTPNAGDEGYVSNYVDNEIMNYLPFDESVIDVTGKNTLSNGTLSYEQGYFGKSVKLDNGYVSLLDHAPGTDSFSVSFWMNTDAITSGDPAIVSNKNWRSGANPGWAFCIAKNNSGIQQNIINSQNASGGKWSVYPSVVSGFENNWTHITLVFDRENNVAKISYNFGTFVKYTNLPSEVSFTTDMPLNIGQDGTGAYGSKFKGLIDEFIIFDGALDEKDLLNLSDYYGKLGTDEDCSFRGHQTVATPESGSAGHINNFLTDKNLQAYIPFDGNANVVAGSMTSALSGTPTFGDGYFGQSANFYNGTYATVNNFDPGLGDFTITSWLKINGCTGDPVFFGNKDWSKGSNAGFLVCMVWGDSGLLIQINYSDGSARQDIRQALPSDYTDGWVHIAFVMDRTNKVVRLYVDFKEVAAVAIPARYDSYSFTTNYPLNIGQDGTGGYGRKPDAYIDEFMLFGNALDADDLKELSTYYGATDNGHIKNDSKLNYNNKAHWTECIDCGMKFNIEAHTRMENSTLCECGYDLAYTDLKIVGAGLNITENINVSYVVTLPETYTAPYMVFEFNGKTYTVTNYTVRADGKLVFKFVGVTPQMVCDNIKATVYADNNGVQESYEVAEYSVKTYCVNMLKKSIDQDLIRLLSALLAYGEKSQIYNELTGTATEGVTLSAGISNYAGISNNVKALVGTADASVTWNGVALRYENAMAIRFTFKADSDLVLKVTIGNRTTTYNVSDLTPNDEGKYIVYFRGITATEYNDTVTASFYNGDTQVGQSVTYSVNSYVYAKQLGSDTALADLVKATFNYGRAAELYVGQ